MPTLIEGRMREARGPVSSKERARAIPPVTTTRTHWRTAISLAMLTALVTRVTGTSGSVSAGRSAISRATSVVVVPPLRPMESPGCTRAAAALAIRVFSSAILEVR